MKPYFLKFSLCGYSKQKCDLDQYYFKHKHISFDLYTYTDKCGRSSIIAREYTIWQVGMQNISCHAITRVATCKISLYALAVQKQSSTPPSVPQ